MELEVTITEQVKQTLKLNDQTIPPEASLIEFGLHSLAIMQLVDAFQEEYKLELNYVDFASMPTIRDWAELLNVDTSTPGSQDKLTSNNQPVSYLMPAEGAKESDLSEMQYSFWAGQQSTDVSAHLYVEFDGQNIDQNRLSQAVRDLLQMHPMLRAVISNNGSQTIAEQNLNYQINIDDLSKSDEADVEAFLVNKRDKLAHQELAIEQGQVIHFDLTLLPSQKHRFHIDVNMVAADAPSILLIYENLANLYEGQNQQLVMSDLSYFDYLNLAEQDQALKLTAEQDQSWWLNRLADIPAPPKLPLIAEKFRLDTYKSDSLHHRFSKQDKQVLQSLADKHDVSLSTLMLAAFSSVVGNWSSSNRFRLNLPMFQRQPYGNKVNNLVGDFTNLLIFSVELFDDEPLGKMLQRFENERKQILEHSAYSGMNVLRDLSKLHEDTEVAPIVYTCGFDQGDIISDLVQQTLGQPVWCVSQGPMVDLDVQVAEHNQGILVNWDIRTAAFKDQVINVMFDAYLSLIQGLVYSSQKSELPLKPKMPLAQRQTRQLSAFVGNSPSFKCQSLATAFWQQVNKQPDSDALVYADEIISYQQLAEDVLKVVGGLKTNKVKQGSCLVIDLKDPLAYVVTTLASLSVGANYILIDSHVSDDVLTQLYKQNKYQFLIADHDKADLGLKMLNYETLINSSLIDDKGLIDEVTIGKEQAYYAYDVEQNKITGVTHQNAVTSINGMIETFDLDQATRLLSLNLHTSKVALLDVFATLSVGGALVLVDQIEQSSASKWINLIQVHSVNTLHCPSARLSTLLNEAEAGSLSSLALTLSGGQTATDIWSKLKRHNKSTQLVAMQGLKSALPYTSFSVCDEIKLKKLAYLPYGRPLPGVTCKVVNEQGADCPNFVVGQLLLVSTNSGEDSSSSKGEWLATHHDNKGIDWLNTGDFAYYLENGEIQLCGSAEFMLNHQGYMIELQNINAVIAGLEGVLGASVHTVIHQGKKQLLAAVVVDSPKLIQEHIHNALAEVLPRHLLPSFYWLAESLPLGVNGCIDTQALLSNCLKLNENKQVQNDVSPLEQAVSYIFSKTIGVDVNTTRPDDDFFDSGGDSLLATHLTATINQYFKGCDLTIVDIFVERTPANLALKIKDKIPELADKIAQVLLKVLGKI